VDSGAQPPNGKHENKMKFHEKKILAILSNLPSKDDIICEPMVFCLSSLGRVEFHSLCHLSCGSSSLCDYCYCFSLCFSVMLNTLLPIGERHDDQIKECWGFKVGRRMIFNT